MFESSLKKNKTINKTKDIILNAKENPLQQVANLKGGSNISKKMNQNPKPQQNFINSSKERSTNLLKSIVEKLDTSLNLPEEEVIK